MAQALSLRSMVATIRYDEFQDGDKFLGWENGREIRWIKVEAVWRSKRRFHTRSTLAEFLAAIQNEPTRLAVVQHHDESWWVRAI